MNTTFELSLSDFVIVDNKSYYLTTHSMYPQLLLVLFAPYNSDIINDNPLKNLVINCSTAICYCSLNDIHSLPMFNLYMMNTDHIYYRIHLFFKGSSWCAIKPSETLEKDINDLIKMMIKNYTKV